MNMVSSDSSQQIPAFPSKAFLSFSLILVFFPLTEQGWVLHRLHKGAVQAGPTRVCSYPKERRQRHRREAGQRSEAAHLFLPAEGRVQAFAHKFSNFGSWGHRGFVEEVHRCGQSRQVCSIWAQRASRPRYSALTLNRDFFWWSLNGFFLLQFISVSCLIRSVPSVCVCALDRMRKSSVLCWKRTKLAKSMWVKHEQLYIQHVWIVHLQIYQFNFSLALGCSGMPSPCLS